MFSAAIQGVRENESSGLRYVVAKHRRAQDVRLAQPLRSLGLDHDEGRIHRTAASAFSPVLVGAASSRLTRYGISPRALLANSLTADRCIERKRPALGLAYRIGSTNLVALLWVAEAWRPSGLRLS
jgi:hypothetical protein